MSIFRSDEYDRDVIVSALLDRELSAEEEQRVRSASGQDEAVRISLGRYTAVREILRSSAPTDLSPAETERTAERVRAHVERTIRVRPLRAPWWRTSVSLPLPLLSAAAAVIIMLAVTAATLAIREGESVPSPAPGLSAISSPDRPINVQVNVDVDHTDRLLQWLNEQGQAQQITVQLPDQVQFQFRGDPVLVRREPVPAEEYQIVPLEDDQE